MTSLDPTSLQALKVAIVADAPNLAKLLDGANAGIAVAALGKALLGDTQASPLDVLGAVRAPDSGTKLKIVEAEQEVQRRLDQADTSLAALAPDEAKARTEASDTQDKILQDVSDARKRQIAQHDQTNAVLAYVVTGGFFALLIFLIFLGNKLLPDNTSGARDLLFTLLGVVGTGWANIIGFYYGSSAGSLQKTQALTAAIVKGEATD